MKLPAGAWEALRYLVVGTVGFVVDGGLLWSLVKLGYDPFWVRCVSFPVAVLCTWWLNRVWTFSAAQDTRAVRQARNYFLVQIVGAASNFLVYSAVLLFVEPTAGNALIAFAFGSAVGLVFNYTLSKFFVFASARANPSE
jgi:putative flippase GtrA